MASPGSPLTYLASIHNYGVIWAQSETHGTSSNHKPPSLLQGWLKRFPEVWNLSFHEYIPYPMGNGPRAISSSWPCSEQNISYLQRYFPTSTILQLLLAFGFSKSPALGTLWLPVRDSTDSSRHCCSTPLPAWHTWTGFHRVCPALGHSFWSSVTHPYFCLHTWLVNTGSYQRNHEELLTTTNTCRQLKSTGLEA